MDVTPGQLMHAVEVDTLCKSYYKSTPVLKGLSLQVPLGKIYGLLGPSGCGKTTLLKCVVGRLKPDAGVVQVMGGRPGKPGHRVPGNLIGYMPQDLALYQDFTVSETMYYFGRIFHMPSQEIDRQTDFLVTLLELPSKRRLICQLSGGQQRRVSFACALLHRPPLLILDEPTEARQGHMVALMRDGRLLAEAKPQELLDRYNDSSLESVFLKLCEMDSEDSLPDTSAAASSTSAAANAAASTSEIVTENSPLLPKPSNHDRSLNSSPAGATSNSNDGDSLPNLLYKEYVPLGDSLRSVFALPSLWHILAVVGKNFNNLRRRLTFLAFQFILPIIQIVLFCVCVGGDPFGLTLASVNLDSSGELGAKFMTYLDNNTFHVKPFKNLEEARTEVRNVRAWAVLSLGANFSTDLLARFSNPTAATNATLSGGSVHLQLDNSNYQVSLMIQKSVAESFQKFAGDLLSQFGLSPELVSLPVVMDAPLLGTDNPSFTEFMAPGMIVTIVFFMATGLTALSFVLERKEGLLDRSLVAGVTILELMLGHMLTQLLIMAGQTGLLLFFSLVVFQVPCHGSVLWVILLALLNGFTGMSLGLMISALCSAENSAIQAALGTMYPNLLLSGIIWPAEAMPQYLRFISRGLPISQSVEAMRSVLSRGFGFTAAPVYLGFVSAIAWASGLLLLALLLLRIRGI
uniref:ABC transporter domain-containing protein n=1 Tax=Macrostomum lignano TaxID=282301 RepID=A0A1I8G3A4_9PLAT